MKSKALFKAFAVAGVLVLCLSLLCLFPLSALATGTDEPSAVPENSSTASSLDGEAPVPDSQPPVPEEPEEDSKAVSALEEQADSENSVSRNEYESTSPPPAGSGEEIAESEREEPAASESEPEGPASSESEPEEPPAPDTSSLLKSSRTVPGYNVFEVNSYAALAKALSGTSYPSEEYPEKSVYILLTGDVRIEYAFAVHSSIEKVTIDGDGLYTLSETSRARTQVSSSTLEVKFKDLTILGRQFFGLFDNLYTTDVLYIYERVKYTGPQLLWAFNSTAHFYDCDINIVTALDPAHEVAEIRDIHMFGNNQINHSSSMPVFLLYYGGNLTISADATLSIHALGNNDSILQTVQSQSALRLEDRATLHIQGSSRRLATGGRLHSIYLGNSAFFHWEANLSGYDYISINADGGAKDAIYLSENAEFRVAPFGAASDCLIRIDGGNVVVGPGATLSLRSILYTAPYNIAPFYLAAGSSLTVGRSANFTMEIANRSDLSNGLIHFVGGRQSGFFVEEDATVVIRGNRAKGAVCFIGANSRVEITDPNYLEIAVTLGFPIYFYNASAVFPCTITYTDVQQINYWGAGSKTYLEGGRYLSRWAAEAGKFSVKATMTNGGNKGVSLELAGDPLDSFWTPTLDATNFDMSNARILSVGKINMDVGSDGNVFYGQLTAPKMGLPYSQGTVQLRVGLPKSDRAVSALSPAAPQFQVSPNHTVGENEEISLWAEYGYIFHRNPPVTAGGTVSFSAPEQIQFGTLTVPFADMEASALDDYALHVKDERGAGNGWQVMASFSGFGNMARQLESTLVVNNIPLGETPRQIVASNGSKTVPLEARLRVPGGAVEAGTYTGTITWTVVDAP